MAEITHVKRFFSPNGDGRRDVDRITFTVKEAGRVTVTIVNRDGDRVRRLADGIERGRDARAGDLGRPHRRRPARAGRPLPDAGRAAPHRPHGRRARAPSTSTRRPRPVVLSVTPPIAGPGAGRVRDPRPRRRPPAPAALPHPAHRREPGRARSPASTAARAAAAASGTGARRRPAPPGTYMVVVAVRDRSGNVGTAPAVLPPVPGQVRGQARDHRPPDHRAAATRARARGCTRGVLRRLAPPPLPLEHPPRRRRAAAQAGPRRARAHARAARPEAGSRAPTCCSCAPAATARSVPFLVQAPQRARLLVVVPAITWLGVDKVDDDGDGLPNTLEAGGPVKWPRVIKGDHGLPADVRRPDRAAARLPRPRARSATTSPPTSRSPAPATRARPTARASCSRARCDGCRGPGAAAAALRRGRRPAGELRHGEPAARGARSGRTGSPGRRRRRRRTRSARAWSPSPARAPARTAGRRCRSARSPTTPRSACSPAPTACSTRSAASRSPRSAPETRAREGARRAGPGRHGRRARRRRGEGRAAARGAARADRDAARQGRRRSASG